MADHFEITSSVLPRHTKVAAFRGTEGISRPYLFDVYVTVDGSGDDIDVDDAPGARVTLIIHDQAGMPSRIHGMIASMELVRSVVTDGSTGRVHSLYRLHLVPLLWQLSLTKHSRIWSGKSIPEILQEVLADEGVADVSLRLDRSYDTEEHVCQYKESSLSFIHRWMERLGLYYFFEQGESGETLVITDHNATSVPSIARPVPYYPLGGGDAPAGAHLDAFSWRHATAPMAVRVTDYDYARPALAMVGRADVSPVGLGEQVTYGGRFFTRQQGETLASVRAEDLRAQAKTFHGSGSVYGLSSGYRFTLDRHPRAQLNTEYLATAVEHFGAVSDAMRTWAKVVPHEHLDQTYYVEVTAIDANQQYRHPETTPWPRLDGFENAVVDGPANSEYAQLDDHGRYKLKFKFDEGMLKGGKASTWVRKMQPHAGTVEGWHFPERAGTEVICAFLGGDPDRPIIIGAVPTVTTQSPVTSQNYTQNVIQTGGKNRVEMEDQAGKQRVTISTPHQSSFISLGHPLTGMGQVYNGDQAIPDHHMAIWTDGRTLMSSGSTTDLNVGENWNVWVQANHVERVLGNVVHYVFGNVEQEIKGTLLQEVQGSVTEAYHDTLTQGVQGAVALTHDATFDHTVEALVTETFNAGQTTNISGGDHVLTVDGSETHSITGSQTLTIDGSQTITVKANLTQTWKAATNSFTHGPAVSMYYGIRNDTTLGVFISESLALRAEISAAVKLSLIASAKFEIAPTKVNINLNRSQVAAQKAEAAAIRNRMLAVESSLSAVRSFTVAAARENHALISKAGAVYSSVSALRSHMAGLHSQM